MTVHYPWLQASWEKIKAGNLKTYQPLLIAGAAGRGQWDLAQQAAKAFLCEQADKPCGFCPSCNAFDAKTHADLWFLNDDGDSISVDTARLLSEHLHQKPMRANGCRVVLIEHFDRATVAAQQSLLKIFEEPFVKTAVILTARYIDRVLPTIRSRMALMNIPPVPREMYQQWCADHGMTYESYLYDLTDGSPLVLKDLDVEKLLSLKSAIEGGAPYGKWSTLADAFERPILFAMVYHVLAQRAKQSLAMKDFERVDAWKSLYHEAGLSKSVNWGLQCRAFFVES